MNRRNFLLRAGQAGGYTAAFALMQALDLAPAATKVTKKNWSHDSGRGKTAVILGGGIAGLCAAYELQQAGFRITLLEARERPGGRNWTIRDGDEIEFSDGTTQTANWQSTSYFNAGPARLPSIHKNILKYCHDLGVPLEVEINSSRSALLVNPNAFEGKAIEQREAINDTRGHVSELLAKCINQSALDDELTPDDRLRMLDFLRTYGDLDRELKYTGSERAGVSRLPGAGDVSEKLRQPLDMRQLLNADFWHGMLFEDEFDYQATMFQPVGGMDRIAYAFAKTLGKNILYNAPVTAIHKLDGGVRVTTSRRTSGIPSTPISASAPCPPPSCALLKTTFHRASNTPSRTPSIRARTKSPGKRSASGRPITTSTAASPGFRTTPSPSSGIRAAICSRPPASSLPAMRRKATRR